MVCQRSTIALPEPVLSRIARASRVDDAYDSDGKQMAFKVGAFLTTLRTLGSATKQLRDVVKTVMADDPSAALTVRSQGDLGAALIGFPRACRIRLPRVSCFEAAARHLLGSCCVDLDLTGNKKVANLRALSSLTALQRLSLKGIKLGDGVPPLEALTNLEHLNLRNTRVADLTGLRALRQLQTLLLDKTLVTDLQPLAVCSQLKILRISETKVREVAEGKLPCTLQQLSLHKSLITELTGLAVLVNLEQLHLGPSASAISE